MVLSMQKLKSYVCILYIVIIVFCLEVVLIINGKKQVLMIIKELFDWPVGDFCIAVILSNVCLVSTLNDYWQS